MPAAAQVSVEVSPLRVEVDALPGSTTTQAVTLRNYGKAPVRVRARLTDWDLTRDGTPQFEASVQDGPFSATSWVRVAPPEVTIEPGAEALVRFSLTVPKEVEAGGYRSGILFDFGPPESDLRARASVTFRGRVATLIYVHVGTVPGAAELMDVSVREVAAETHVVALVRNSSRRSLRTRGTLVLLQGEGQPVRQLTVPDVPVLPESEREVSIPLSGRDASPLPTGDYKVELKIDLGLPALLVGETQLKVSH
ncbi:MAG TPA: hypothetical protein VD833_18880 [Vicinamibacterales bacterium]|nr:hypothetical protein [Vicinamibacterales bacterium]